MGYSRRPCTYVPAMDVSRVRISKPNRVWSRAIGSELCTLKAVASALTTECDLAVVLDHQFALGDGHQCMGGFGHQRGAGEVKNVPKMDPSHVMVP